MRSADSPKGRGLSAAELALAAAELAPLLRTAVVLDAALVADSDDVLLVLSRNDRKLFLHVALGQERARVCTTARRFTRSDLQPGPRTDALLAELSRLSLPVLVDCTAADGQQRRDQRARALLVRPFLW